MTRREASALHRRTAMATNASGSRSSARGGARPQHRRRAKTARRSRARNRVPRTASRSRQRETASEVEINIRQAGENLRRVGVNTRQAVGNVVEAGQAATTAARHAASEAVERLPEMAERIPQQVGEQAQDTATALLDLPHMVRKGARRGREAVEQVGARAAVSLLHTGTRVLSAAADYLSEVSPRRRLDRAALEDVLREQLDWANTAIEAYDRCATDVEEDELRTRLVRAKLEAVKQSERLTMLMQRLSMTVPTYERRAPAPETTGANGGAAATRQGLAHALTISVQRAEGWRALARLAPMMRAEDVADAALAASEAVGEGPDQEVEFLRQALLQRTIDYVLR
jgi:hypothetical protein